MSIVFHYEEKVVIKRSRNVVVDEFLNYEGMKEWQPTLQKVELIQGRWKEENHQVHLTYLSKENNEMTMEESIESMSLPHKMVHTYRVGSTFNRNTSYFESFGADTMWILDVEFHFDAQPNSSQLTFERQTRKSMKEFKKYVENL